MAGKIVWDEPAPAAAKGAVVWDDDGQAEPSAPVPEGSIWDALGDGAKYTLDALNRTAANQIEGLSFNTAHRWAPHIFAAVDEGREMFNAAPDQLYSDRVKDHRAQWNQHLDPTLSAIGGMPAQMLAPGMNTLGGGISAAALNAIGSIDQRGKALSDADAQDEMKWSMGLAALPFGLGGVARGAPMAVRAVGARVPPAIGNIFRGGYVKPTAEAQRLMSEGVELTLGQMNPNSMLGRFEEAAVGKATGGSLKMMRDQVVDSARDVLMSKVPPPGARPPVRGAAVPDQLRQLEAGFRDVYEGALSGEKLQPEVYLGRGKWRGLFTDTSLQGGAKTKGAFEAAVDSVKDATPSAKRRALAFLEDAADSLRPTKTGPNTGKVDASDIQSLRTKLRDKIRGLSGEGDDRQLREMYDKAEGFVSELLEGQLPPEKAKALREADHAYRNLLAVDRAASGARAFRNGGNFTMADVLEAIRQKGSTPELETFARDADRVLSAKVPLTGALSALQEVAPGGKYLGPAWAHMTNTVPFLRQHALGQASLGDLLPTAGRSSTSMRTLYDMLRGPELESP